MPNHLPAVHAIYAAFGRGDVASILEHMSDDVAWESWADNQAQRAGVPWMTARHGKRGVQDFFESLGATLRIDRFDVLDIMPGERQVAVEFVISCEILATGAKYTDEEIHLWTFDAEGKVSRLRHYTDTAKHIATARGA